MSWKWAGREGAWAQALAHMYAPMVSLRQSRFMSEFGPKYDSRQGICDDGIGEVPFVYFGWAGICAFLISFGFSVAPFVVFQYQLVGFE